MTRLLASVASVDEAVIALDGGADLIDLKDPAAGALGAWSISEIERAVRVVAGRRLLSATIGDRASDVDDLAERTAATAAAGVDFVKVGFFPGGPHQALAEALAREAGRGAQIIAVIFADRLPDFGLLDRLAGCGFTGAMLDTADKHGTSLRQCLDDARLGGFVDDARCRGLLVGLAGSLSLADVAPLVQLNPDYLGFRGALCEAGRRENRFDPGRLARIRALIPAAARTPITARPPATPQRQPVRTAPPIP